MIVVVRINGVRVFCQFQDWVEDLLVRRAGHVCFYDHQPGKLALVVDDEPGYRPLYFAEVLSADQVTELAEALNEMWRVPPDQASRIVGASIRLSNARPRRLDLANTEPAGRA